METIEIAKLVLGSGGILGIGFLIFKIGRFSENFNNFKNDVNKRFDRIDYEFKEVRNDISDVKERITYLEAETIMFNLEPEPNLKSLAAKKTWQRRKAKQIAKLEKK